MASLRKRVRKWQKGKRLDVGGDGIPKNRREGRKVGYNGCDEVVFEAPRGTVP
jgi:hypothetical protein